MPSLARQACAPLLLGQQIFQWGKPQWPRLDELLQCFAARLARKAELLGLAGLRERAQLLKGTISVHSRPGEGTTVEARIPVGEPGELD